MPGEDVAESLRVVFGELPDLPYLPELPARGPGADIVGRTAALLADLHVDLQPSGWRLVDRPGHDVRRARDLLRRDLDALELTAAGYVGPLKVQAGGPWTLAASVELPRGDRAVADPGASRDLAQSLAEGLRGYLAEVRTRVPGARVVMQLDEPSLPAVLAGTVRTASGYGTLRAVEEPVAESALAAVVSALDAVPVVHCCAARVPVALLVRAGVQILSLDAALLAARDHDPLGEALDAGTGLMLGVVPTADPGTRQDPGRLADPARALWRRLGFAPEKLPEQVMITPACGLAGATPAYAVSALRLARETARSLLHTP